MGAGTGNGSDGLKSAAGDRTARVPARVTAPEGWVPAFEGQRPPFQPGHELSMKHGADSPRRLDPVAQALAVELLADDAVSYLRAPRYAVAVAAWAKVEAKCALLSEWIDGMPLEQATNSKAGAMAPLELLRKWETTALTHRSRLGLDPLSAARLGRDVASTQVDIAKLLTASRDADTLDEQDDTP